MKAKQVDQFWYDVIKPWCVFAQHNRGFQSAVLQELRQYGLGKNWYGQQVEMWLCADDDRRKQPLAGAGILLLACCEEAKKKLESERR